MKFKEPFILGLKPNISNSAFLDIRTIYKNVGKNTGNLAFHHAIDIQLGGNVKTLPRSTPPSEINMAGEVAILPCANFLGSHTNYKELALAWRKVKVPMVAVGLGAQSNINNAIPVLTQGTLDWIRIVADRASGNFPNIALRGEFSREVLQYYSLDEKAIVLGCPTLFLNPDPHLGQLIESRMGNPDRIAVVAGDIGWHRFSAIEQSLVRLAQQSKGAYIGQGSIEMLEVLRGDQADIHPENLKICRDYAAPHMELSEFSQWTRSCGSVFFDIPTWMEYYRRFDFVVGLRIHGVMLALQAGVPGLCIVHDSRTLELCKTMMVPYVMVKDVINGIDKKQLLELFDFDATEFDRNRIFLAKKYVDFLNSNFIRCADWLTRLAETEK